ncbi:MAG TPA: hypothetical protein VMU71_06570 [Terracidiphilus sp.]|nr:hypothetical protein [Terracidiphilus sp.]
MMTGNIQKTLFGAAFSPRMGLHGVLPAALCFAFIWPFGGGWKTVHMMAGNMTPGARGTIRFKIGDNGNTELNITVRALAAPSSLTPPEDRYVVWIQPPGKPAHNLGALNIDSHENGELNTETPDKRFTIFITAEQNANESEPEGPTVLSATVTQGA